MPRVGTLAAGILLATTAAASAHSTEQRLADQMYQISVRAEGRLIEAACMKSRL